MGIDLSVFILYALEDSPYGKASREALATYAEEIEEHDRALSENIFKYLNQIMGYNNETI